MIERTQSPSAGNSFIVQLMCKYTWQTKKILICVVQIYSRHCTSGPCLVCAKKKIFDPTTQIHLPKELELDIVVDHS